MKTTKSFTIDAQVWAEARKTYPSVSKKIENLLRSSLDIKEDVKEADAEKRVKQLEDEQATLKARLTEINFEAEKVKEKDKKEKSRWVEI